MIILAEILVKTDADNQYSWRTKFASLAWKYRPFTIAPVINDSAVYTASTFMGDNFEMVRVSTFSLLT